MSESTKSPKQRAARPMSAEQGERILRELHELRALLPLSIDGLVALQGLQERICKTATKHLDPRQAALDDIVERMSEDIGANIARDIVAAIEVKMEPFVPILMMMGKDYVEAKAKAPTP